MGQSKNSFKFENFSEFDDHKLVSFLYDLNSGLRGFISIHRGGLVLPAFGATRIWKYSSELDALRDALRLARLMSYKSALAGLKYGGAKAVIFASDGSRADRTSLIKSYTQHVNYLNGRFITGADVGVTEQDLKTMIGVSKFIVGGKSDPVKYTAAGVFYAIQVCLKEIFGNELLTGRTFAIQGLGKTGTSLLKLIYKEAEKIYVSDISLAAVKDIKRNFPKVEVVSASEIYKQKVDVFAPCALSHSVNHKTVPSLNCKIVAGSANNQLEDKETGETLYRLGILYAPDYAINAGGLITVVDEYENGDTDQDRLEEKVFGIKRTMKSIIEQSKKTGKATNLVADEMAEKIFDKFI